MLTSASSYRPNVTHWSERGGETIVDTAGRGGLIDPGFHNVDVEFYSKKNADPSEAHL